MELFFEDALDLSLDTRDFVLNVDGGFWVPYGPKRDSAHFGQDQDVLWFTEPTASSNFGPLR